eukprot:1522222-Pleurochrysis_carterae.AAC.1
MQSTPLCSCLLRADRGGLHGTCLYASVALASSEAMKTEPCRRNTRAVGYFRGALVYVATLARYFRWRQTDKASSRPSWCWPLDSGRGARSGSTRRTPRRVIA